MSQTAVLPATPAWTLGTRPVKRFTGAPLCSDWYGALLARTPVKMSSLLLRSTGELQPGPGEHALASHYAVCSTVTTEPAFSIPGGRGIGSSK